MSTVAKVKCDAWRRSISALYDSTGPLLSRHLLPELCKIVLEFSAQFDNALFEKLLLLEMLQYTILRSTASLNSPSLWQIIFARDLRDMDFHRLGFVGRGYTTWQLHTPLESCQRQSCWLNYECICQHSATMSNLWAHFQNGEYYCY